MGGALLFSSISPPSASAQAADAADCSSDEAFLSVLQVEGRLDEVLVDFVHDHVDDLESSCAVGLLLQVDSSGVSEVGDSLDDLVAAMEDAAKPIDVWVGPTGSRATGAAVRLLAMADRTGVAAPGSRIEVTPELAASRDVSDADLDGVRLGERIGGERAVELGLVDTDASVLIDFIGEMELVDIEVVGEGEDAERQPATPTVFSKLPLIGQLMHTVASPAVAYLLFVIGLALLLFEMYSAGLGIAGMVGAGCLLLGSYGLSSLPTNPIGVTLLLVAAFGYAVDVQTGVPRLWTAIATVAFVAGSIQLFDGPSLSWITMVVAFVGMSLFMLRGMPVMVRSRFSTPALDREWLIGESGTTTSSVSPDGGTVSVREAPWAASVNEGTVIEPGQRVRVVAVDGFSLTVEPDTEGEIDAERTG